MSLTLSGFHLRNAPAGDAAALRAALAGHPRLRALSLDAGHDAGEAAAVGALLGAVVAADAPSLTHLTARGVATSVDGYTPLLLALPRNGHLRVLALQKSRELYNVAKEESLGEEEPPADVSQVRLLVHAVTQNGSLRELDASLFEEVEEAHAELLVRLVAQRSGSGVNA
jgi:hypothetical protein